MIVYGTDMYLDGESYRVEFNGPSRVVEHGTVWLIDRHGTETQYAGCDAPEEIVERLHHLLTGDLP